jgi:hypothetical protein
MGNETVATYVIEGRKYDVVGCWDEETPQGRYDFYDVYDDRGQCQETDMGLTIHYHLTTKASTTHEQAAKFVKALRQRCLDLPFKTVSEVHDVQGDECDFNKATGSKRWLLIQARPWVSYKYDAAGRNPKTIRGEGDLNSEHPMPSKIVAFTAWPGDGCEAANIGLVFVPEIKAPALEGDRRGDHVAVKVGNPWLWNSFCKTGYSEDFAKAHLSVVAMLDAAEEIGKDIGVRLRVKDEGEYWETRDAAVLVGTEKIDAATRTLIGLTRKGAGK